MGGPLPRRHRFDDHRRRDACGSSSYRSRVFKTERARLATTIGVVITIWHTPHALAPRSGTSETR